MDPSLSSIQHRQLLTELQFNILLDTWKSSPVTSAVLSYLTDQRNRCLFQAEELGRADADKVADLLVQSKTFRELIDVIKSATFAPTKTQQNQ